MDGLNPIKDPNQSITETMANRKGHWLLVAVIILVIAGLFVIWWTIGRTKFNIEQLLENSISNRDEIINQDNLSQEVNDINLGDLDSEFKAIDVDLNNL